MLYYLDASAWVKRYFDEIGSSFVRDLFAGRWDFCCSPLGLIEVGSTIARKRKTGEVTPQEFAMKRASLLNDWQRFLRVEMTPSVVKRALDVTSAHGLRGADSLHLASALNVKEELGLVSKDFAVISSDQELNAALVSRGLSVFDPTEQADGA